MLSFIALVKLEVLRITSALPAAFIRAKVADHLVFIGRMRRDGLEAWGLCVLHGQVPESSDPEDGNALMRLEIRATEPAINRVAGAEDWRGLLEGHLVGKEVSGASVHRHVFLHDRPALRLPCLSYKDRTSCTRAGTIHRVRTRIADDLVDEIFARSQKIIEADRLVHHALETAFVFGRYVQPLYIWESEG